jgi:hypothetical protein
MTRSVHVRLVEELNTVSFIILLWSPKMATSGGYANPQSIMRDRAKPRDDFMRSLRADNHTIGVAEEER